MAQIDLQAFQELSAFERQYSSKVTKLKAIGGDGIRHLVRVLDEEREYFPLTVLAERGTYHLKIGVLSVTILVRGEVVWKQENKEDPNLAIGRLRRGAGIPKPQGTIRAYRECVVKGETYTTPLELTIYHDDLGNFGKTATDLNQSAQEVSYPFLSSLLEELVVDGIFFWGDKGSVPQLPLTQPSTPDAR